ncbi:MAG TPA: hypothetical protein VK842_03290 [bacterium]|jgi:hypothetical protein|nr:hypothetical protein [bacterium]
MKARTAAEQQIEMLRQMKESKSKRKPTPPPAPAPAAQPARPAFELNEAQRPARVKTKGPSLPLSKETWRLLRQRQSDTHEFRSRRAMGDWAAALLLALPPGAHGLGEEAKAELLRRLAEWADARGLRP